MGNEAATSGAGEQTQNATGTPTAATGQTGTPAVFGQAQQAQQAQPVDDGQDGYKGAGGKAALLADLAAERDKRQAAETAAAELAQFRDGLAKLVGAKADEVTPEQLQAKLDQAEKARTEQAKQLAVYASAPAGVDVAGLLDSRSFLDRLAAVDDKPETIAKTVEEFVQANPRFGDKPETIAKTVEEFVQANPRFGAVQPGAGSRDITAGASRSNAASKSMDDWIRGL